MSTQKTTKMKLSNLALVFSTIAFLVNFSVWTLYSVISIDLKESLDLEVFNDGDPVALGRRVSETSSSWLPSDGDRLMPRRSGSGERAMLR